MTVSELFRGLLTQFVFCLNFQAFNSGHSDGEGHKMNIYKSCVIMAGIYVFFLVECTMKARLAGRKRSQEDLHMCDEVTSPDKTTKVNKRKTKKS